MQPTAARSGAPDSGWPGQDSFVLSSARSGSMHPVLPLNRLRSILKSSYLLDPTTPTISGCVHRLDPDGR
jgi:hypothetical protein